MERITRELIDDMDEESPADQSLAFMIEQVHYSIDLNEKHAEALRKALAPYVKKARRTGGRQTPRKAANSNTSSPAKTPRSRVVREWAAANGIECNERGHVPNSVQQAYDAAHEQMATSA